MGHGGVSTVAAIAIASFIMCIILFATRPAPTYNGAASTINISTVFLNMTLGGYCEGFTITVGVTKIVRDVSVYIPTFTCNGSVNPTAVPGGVYFTLPEGLDADVPYPYSGGSTTISYMGEEVVWRSSLLVEEEILSMRGTRGNGTSVAIVDPGIYNDTTTYITGRVVVMGTEISTDLPLPPAVQYGPWYGHTLKFVATTSNSIIATTSQGNAVVLSIVAMAAWIGATYVRVYP